MPTAPDRHAEPSTSGPLTQRQLAGEVLEDLRVLIVAGMTVGVLVAGFGSRLAMLLLRLTSPDSVQGVTSDDGFTIGRITLGGTYNLLLLGAAVGVIGAAAYRVVAPRLIGPSWFRRLTTGLASAAVVGSMLVHADGVDFTLLGPTWLAIGLFVALPGLFGVLIGPAVDRVARPGSWTTRGRWRWGLPLVLVACFPPTLFVLAVSATVLALWVPLRHHTALRQIRSSPPYTQLARGLWLFVALVGLRALVADITALV